MKGNIVVFCAHSDDQIIGPGGALIKYIEEGKNVFTYIFSKGELSHPHIKAKVIADVREREAKKADKLIGGKGVKFFDLKEGTFSKQKEQTIKKIVEIITKLKPEKIFTHSDLDVHPDHRTVCNIVLESRDKSKINSDVYCFDVWGGFHFNKLKTPRLYVDISKTFTKKLKALECFKSQWYSRLLLTWTVYVGAFIHGFFSGFKFAERFYKLR